MSSLAEFHKITQHPPRSPFSNVSSAALVAASKTSSTPSPVSDEHSKYFRAPISCAASLPSFVDVKCSDFFLISSIARGSSRRSFFRPTRIMGTFGQRSLASSTHCCHRQSASTYQEQERGARGGGGPGWRGGGKNLVDPWLTLCLTLSKESGVSTENPIRRT